MMRALVLSHVFPRPKNPMFGVFVRQRVEHVARRVPVEVISPLPWFPGGHRLGRSRRSEVPSTAVVGGVTVHYPTVVSIPGIARSFDPILFAIALLPFLRQLRRRYPFHLIDAHFGYPDGVAAALLGKWLGCPVLITLRGFEHDIPARSLIRRQLAWALRRSRVITVSAPLAQLARELGAVAVRTIANGVDSAVFCPGDRAEARRQLGLPADATILLQPAAFVRVKRQDRLLRVVARLRDAGQKRILLVALGAHGGAHSCLNELHRLVGELDLEARVRFVSERPHEEMPLWYRAADLGCLTSEREGCPNAILEALACGLPVVSTGVGEVPQLVRSGIDGYVSMPFDTAEFAAAVARALETNWNRAAIAARGAQRSWDDVAREVVEEMQAATEAR